MAKEVSLLYGSCACERNQYEIELPLASTSLASVFFDNSAQSRRPQASPVTAWLRIPLDFYHSATIAQFPDETHATIRRTYTTALSPSTIQTTRRQFCGYCGTHLTAFDESQNAAEELIDVTLGSLLDESLDRLQSLNVLPDGDEEDVEEEEDQQEQDAQTAQNTVSKSDGLVKGGEVDHDETHIPVTASKGDGLVTGGDVNHDETHIPVTAIGEQLRAGATSVSTTRHAPRVSIGRYMQHRGMPYFEEMIENSSLGRIRRQKGGHRTPDGKTAVHWEIVEYDGDEIMQDAVAAPAAGNVAKKIKLSNE